MSYVFPPRIDAGNASWNPPSVGYRDDLPDLSPSDEALRRVAANVVLKIASETNIEEDYAGQLAECVLDALRESLVAESISVGAVPPGASVMTVRNISHGAMVDPLRVRITEAT